MGNSHATSDVVVSATVVTVTVVESFSVVVIVDVVVVDVVVVVVVVVDVVVVVVVVIEKVCHAIVKYPGTCFVTHVILCCPGSLYWANAVYDSAVQL